MSEQDFRTLIEKINDGLVKAYNPFSPRNWLDTALGVLTGWIWEDFGLGRARRGVRDVEALVVAWNEERVRQGGDEEAQLVRCIELRKSAFMSVSL